MFYSQTFLARKGPLGTVWCAAHLQHKLKKSQYTSTDIPSTVERIMCPEVPLALRMSSYLLLGVVRIYSKKVDYLHHDCNLLWVSLRNAFRAVDINLPDNATHAPFHAVTLPETYELDALDIDDQFAVDGSLDNHLKSQEEITVADKTSTERELYVTITLGDDNLPEEASSRENVEEMQHDISPATGINLASGIHDPELNTQTVHLDERFEEDSVLPDFPEIEGMRDRDDNDVQFTYTPVMLRDENAAMELNRSPLQDIHEKEICTPTSKDISHSRGQSPQFQLQSELPSSAANGAPPFSDSHLGIAKSAELVVRSTPPAQKLQARKRKRKQFFDRTLALSNEFMKKALENCDDLKKKRKKLPCSALDMWRSNNNNKKDQIFQRPVISGICADLQNVSNKDYVLSKQHLLLSEGSEPQHTAASSPAPSHITDTEPEQLREADHHADTNLLSDLPSHVSFSASSPHGKEQTPSLAGDIDSVPVPHFGTDIDTGLGSASDVGMSTGAFRSDFETPMTNLEDRLGVEDAALSDIHELTTSAEADDLAFLDVDNNTPTDLPGSREGDPMSVRTRAFAQYLKRHSPTSRDSDGPSGELSLNNILVGRSRKLCARMFFETLVLKSYGLIDVEQPEPYSTITLKLTSTFSKAEI